MINVNVYVTVSDVLKSFSFSPAKKRNRKDSVNGNFRSLYLWLDTEDLCHADKIRSGIIVQQFIKELVLNSKYETEIIGDDVINSREADLLFKLKSDLVSKIYYREIKGNTNLDSEKRPANWEKISVITQGLRTRYPGYEVDGGFLCPAWLNSEHGVEGFNDFVSILGYDELSFEEFIAFGKELGKKVRELLK